MGHRDGDAVILTANTYTHVGQANKTLFADSFGPNDGVLREKPKRGQPVLPTGLACTCNMPTASYRRDTGKDDVFDCRVCGGVSSKVTDLSRRHPSLPKLPGQRTISDADLDALSARIKPRVIADIRAALREAGLIKDGDER